MKTRTEKGNKKRMRGKRELRGEGTGERGKRGDTGKQTERDKPTDSVTNQNSNIRTEILANKMKQTPRKRKG